MAKKIKEQKVNMSKSSFEDFIWMSYRYCIGRKTIAACTHADTIARVIKDNPGLISPDRIAFNVKDIRNEISNSVNWKKCIHIDGTHFDKDIFTPLLYELNKYPDRKHKVFHFDADASAIYTVVEDNSLYEFEYADCDYTDLIPWVKLANWMDVTCHRVITTVYEGKKEEHICYPWPRQIQNEDGTVTYKEAWSKVEDADRLSSGWHIAEEYITEIEVRE